MAVANTYLGLDSQDDLGQSHDEALEGNGDILQNKVGDPHDPQQVKEIQGLKVGLQEYQAGGTFRGSSHLFSPWSLAAFPRWGTS